MYATRAAVGVSHFYQIHNQFLPNEMLTEHPEVTLRARKDPAQPTNMIWSLGLLIKLNTHP